MAILWTFIRWWVWWGEGALYVYFRPLVWLCHTLFLALVRRAELSARLPTGTAAAIARKSGFPPIFPSGEVKLSYREAQAVFDEPVYPKFIGKIVVHESYENLTDDELMMVLHEARTEAPWEVYKIQLVLNSPRRVAGRYFG